jgi:DNA-binding IclR family transcriptional regulator
MKDESNGVRAVERAVRLLDVLAEVGGPRSLSELAGLAELSVPTAFRLLRTLQQQGLVTAQAPGNRYALGYRILELAHALVGQIDIVGLARPVLTATRNRVNETTALVVQVNDHWVPIASAEATHSLRRVIDLGERTPLYADSTGKVFLAAMSDQELDDYLARTSLVAFSDSTVVDTALLRAQVSEARAAGVAVSVNERGFGGAGVAAPVRDHDGRVPAVVTIASPASRFDDALRQSCVQAVREATEQISRALGYRSPAAGPPGRRTDLEPTLLTEGNGLADLPTVPTTIETSQEVLR